MKRIFAAALAVSFAGLSPTLALAQHDDHKGGGHGAPAGHHGPAGHGGPAAHGPAGHGAPGGHPGPAAHRAPAGHGGPAGPMAHRGPGGHGGPMMGHGAPARWARGGRLPSAQRHWVSNWSVYHLRRPPGGYRWVQVGNQFLLVAVATGVILDVVTQ